MGEGWVYEPLSSSSSKNPFWSLDSNKFKEPSVPDFGKVSESEEPWFQFTGTGEFSQNFIEPVWPWTPKHQDSVNSHWKAFSAHIGPVWCLGVNPGSKNIKEPTLNSWFYADSFMKTTSSLKNFKNLVLSWKPEIFFLKKILEFFFQTESGGFVILKIFRKPELEVVHKIKRTT